MAVFTALTRDEIVALLAGYSVGDFVAFEGIPSGIENTNFFLTTTAAVRADRFREIGRGAPAVLSGPDEAPGAARPAGAEPAATAHGSLLSEARRKPVAIVSRLPGRAVVHPTAAHVAQVGQFLASMHQQARDFQLFQPNLRGSVVDKARCPARTSMSEDSSRNWPRR